MLSYRIPTASYCVFASSKNSPYIHIQISICIHEQSLPAASLDANSVPWEQESEKDNDPRMNDIIQPKVGQPRPDSNVSWKQESEKDSDPQMNNMI